MKKIIFLSLSLASVFSFSQSWNIAGNTGTDASLNFLGTKENQDLVLKTNNIERLRVSSAGKVAIGGAVHPDLALKVYGRTQIFSNIDGDGLSIQNDLENLSSGIDLLFLRYVKYQPNNPGIMMVSGMTSPTKYEAFFNLRSNGKLGLGTVNFQNCTDCADYRLFVKDGIKTEKIKVDIASANGWADYVFKKDYELATLEEVEKHIVEKGHLFNIPSADEVVKNGINLGEMDSKLLSEIEELTLYSIDLNKKNKTLDEKIQQQEQIINELSRRMNQLEKQSH